jgi:Rieske Fe-S protein
MERRKFIRSSCRFCALGAVGYFLPQLTACSPAYPVFKTELVDKKITMPLSMFNTAPVQFVRPKGWYFDVAVEKKQDNTFTALLLQCTHQENQLTPAGNSGYRCSLHGSQYDKEGNVRKGPAEKPLTHYNAFVENNNLIIEIPKLPI